MRAALLAQTRTYYVLAFIGLLAWIFGIYPPAWQRVLIVVLTAVAVTAVAALDAPLGHRVHRTRYGTAA
ncbi:hypothetical protein ACFXB3_07295 [Streptomyces sp. NPDC059447]|uniref:hypothetical protein n=1 Tax=Streptomyces sp. NPDC059447 TaxID=3346834 RepID=UPI003674D185